MGFFLVPLSARSLGKASQRHSPNPAFNAFIRPDTEVFVILVLID